MTRALFAPFKGWLVTQPWADRVVAGAYDAKPPAGRRAIVDTNPPFWIDVRLDLVVLGFVSAITITAALVSSLLPGWRLARTDVNGALKDEGRGTTSLRMGRFTRWLVVVEVTVSCVLLVVSGLMTRSIIQNSRFDVPFATQDVLTGGITLDERSFPKAPDYAQKMMAQPIFD